MAPGANSTTTISASRSGGRSATRAPASRPATAAGAGLPTGVAELWERWRELPPTLTPDQVLSAGWLQLSRAPLYRAIGRHEIPAVKLGRRTLVLTVPLLKMLGLCLDEQAKP